MDVRVGDPLVQIRVGGLSHDVPAQQLRLTRWASDSAVLSAVARYLDVWVGTLQSKVTIERSPSGNIRVRPAMAA